MGFESWHAFYTSDLQGVYSLLVLPAFFLLYLFATRRARGAIGETAEARLVRLYALGWSVETLVDPIATGPLLGALPLGNAGATALGLTFVLLGDFRVFLIVFALCDRDRMGRSPTMEALLWAPIVAVSAFAVHAGLGAVFGPLPTQGLWLIHELMFVAMAWVLSARIVPTRASGERVVPLRRITGFVALYYGLWATADVLILSGFDAGWLLRTLPNQLYYAVWVPFVYVTLTRGR